MVDQNTGNLLEAFRTQSNQKQISEPKALSSGQIVPKKSKKQKVRNAMIKVYVNGALILIASALVFVAYKLAVIPQLFPPQVEANTKTKQQAPVATDTTDYQGVANFAAWFAYYWLSGDLQNAKTMTTANFVLPEQEQAKQQVSRSEVWEVDPIDKNRVNVVVKATLKATPSGNNDQQQQNNENQTNETQNTAQPQIVYLSVPLAMKEGNYGVYDIPTFVPAPGGVSLKQQEPVTAPIDANEQQNVQKLARLFLSDYFGGSPEKLSIYYQDGKPRATLQNAKMENVDKITINQVAKNNVNKVMVDVTARTVINGINTQQKFQIFMTKIDGEWKIERTNPNLPVSNVTKK